MTLYATYPTCTSSYREKGIVLQREGGLELLGVVVHSLIHHVAFEKPLSHSAVECFSLGSREQSLNTNCHHCYQSEWQSSQSQHGVKGLL